MESKKRTRTEYEALKDRAFAMAKYKVEGGFCLKSGREGKVEARCAEWATYLPKSTHTPMLAPRFASLMAVVAGVSIEQKEPLDSQQLRECHERLTDCIGKKYMCIVRKSGIYYNISSKEIRRPVVIAKVPYEQYSN